MEKRLVVLLLVLPVVLSGCGSPDEGDPEAAALSTIEAAYETFNSADVDTWVEIRDRGSSYGTDEDRAEVIEYMTGQLTPQVEGGARYENIQCESQGEGEWPVADEGPVEGYYFTCDTSFVDADGVEYPEAFEWVVADGQVVAVRSNR